MKKIFLLMAVILMMDCFVFAEETAKAAPEVRAQGAILMEMETGRVLWGKNEKEPMAMASTTKIMTAILALESGKLDETVVASSNAAAAPKVKMGLSTGEKHRLEDLLYPLLLQSSNDVAVAIAEHIGGSVEEFCQMMTEKAKKIGAEDTLFETPNGLDKGDHHSTAYDMALITRYALQNEKFREIISTHEISIPIKGGEEPYYHIMSTNRLLNEFDGAIGVKSGFTNKAGQCFVGAAERNGITFISVVLASGWGTAGKEQKWKDTKALLNYGFENYTNSIVIKGGDILQEIPVTHSREKQVGLVYGNDVILTLQEEEKKNLKVEYTLPESLDAPLEEGQKVGTASIYVNEEELLGQSSILVEMEIERHDFQNSLKKIINSWLNIGKEGIL